VGPDNCKCWRHLGKYRLALLHYTGAAEVRKLHGRIRQWASPDSGCYLGALFYSYPDAVEHSGSDRNICPRVKSNATACVALHSTVWLGGLLCPSQGQPLPDWASVWYRLQRIDAA